MNQKKIAGLILIVLVLLIGVAAILYPKLAPLLDTDQLAGQSPQSQEQSSGTEDVKISAPDFTVYDAQGNEVRLSDYIGKPIVLNFWASWCGPCQMEMPHFQEKYEEFGQRIHFLMVNMTTSSRETMESATGFIAEQGYTFPVFYDTKTDAATVYGIFSLPTTYFIDADGYLVAQASGAISSDTLQRGIDMIAQQGDEKVFSS